MNCFRSPLYSQVTALFTFLLMVSAPVAMASADAESLSEPQQVIQDISDNLQQVLMRDSERVANEPGYIFQVADEILIPRVDFDKVSSLVLGKHWRRASTEQKHAFAEAFQRLLVRTYSTAFREFKTWEIKHLPLRMKEGAKSIAVRTQVLRPEALPVEVLYRMYRKGGNWMVYDVKIEGISLVTNYRSSFSKEIRKGGMDRLIQRITDLNSRRIAKAEM